MPGLRRKNAVKLDDPSFFLQFYIIRFYHIYHFSPLILNVLYIIQFSTLYIFVLNLWPFINDKFSYFYNFLILTISFLFRIFLFTILIFSSFYNFSTFLHFHQHFYGHSSITHFHILTIFPNLNFITIFV
jgi:hypothetical protein